MQHLLRGLLDLRTPRAVQYLLLLGNFVPKVLQLCRLGPFQRSHWVPIFGSFLRELAKKQAKQSVRVVS